MSDPQPTPWTAAFQAPASMGFSRREYWSGVPFHVLAIVNSASVKTDVHVSFSVMASSGYMPSSGIGGSYSSFGASLMAQRLKHLSAMWEFNPWVGKIPWRRKWQPTPVFLPGESHGERILEGYSPWGFRARHNRVHTHIYTLRP